MKSKSFSYYKSDVSGKGILITAFMLFGYVAVLFSQTRADDVTGYYLGSDPKTNDKFQMEMYRTSNEKYEGKVVWVENKSNSGDVGTVQIRNLVFDSKTGEWKNGKVMYEGSEYSLIVSFTDDGKLKLRGYLGFSLFGRTMYWTKEKELRINI